MWAKVNQCAENPHFMHAAGWRLSQPLLLIVPPHPPFARTPFRDMLLFTTCHSNEGIGQYIGRLGLREYDLHRATIGGHWETQSSSCYHHLSRAETAQRIPLGRYHPSPRQSTRDARASKWGVAGPRRTTCPKSCATQLQVRQSGWKLQPSGLARSPAYPAHLQTPHKTSPPCRLSSRQLPPCAWHALPRHLLPCSPCLDSTIAGHDSLGDMP